MNPKVIGVVVAVIVIALSVPLLLPNGESLEDRAQAWSELLQTGLFHGDRDSEIAAIAKFLEPSAARSTRAREFYEGRENQPADAARIVAVSIDDVKISEDGKSGIVRYGYVIRTGTHDSTGAQLTMWVKKDGKWFRSSLFDGNSAVGEPTAPPIVTMAEYTQIANGATYEQVATIIGIPGEQTSSSTMRGFGNQPATTTVRYSWDNADFSSMNATFQNGRLTSKMQFGLE